MSKEVLAPAKRGLLKQICDTFVPSLESSEHTEFYARKASNINVDGELANIIERELRPESRKQIKQMLSYFQNRPFNLLLHQRFKGFTQLPLEAREQYLTKWANSRIPLRRTGFQALKRLTLFLNYSLPNEKGINPNREAIGYHGPPILQDNQHYTQPIEKLIKSLQLTQETTLECDACIIGSGAGGSVIASTLSNAGLRVIVLEQGSYNTPGHFTQQEYQMTKQLYLDRGTLATKDLSFTLLAGVGAGGGTVVNWMTSLRPPQWLLEEWEQDYGITDLTKPQFTKHIQEVEETLHIGTEDSQRNPNNEVLWTGCKKLGYTENKDFSTIPRNASQCNQRCGPCGYGCNYSCKQSTILNYLPKAYQAGAQFLFNTRAELIELSQGKTRSVEATYENDQHQFPIHVKCKIVVVACGAINTTALLLHSRLGRHVGRGLLLDPTTAIASIYPRSIKMWEGPMQTVNVTRFLNLDGQHHGFWLEAVPGHPGLLASSIPWLSGRRHKEMMLQSANAAGTIVLLREKGSGTISIDKHGAPICSYHLHPLDQKHMIEGIIEAARINFAAGAQEVRTLHTRECFVRADKTTKLEAPLEELRNQIKKAGMSPNRLALFSAHLMGGCPMGNNADRATTDSNGQINGADGIYVGDASVFPTTPGVNPMITIMAMARRTAEAILTERKKTST